MHKHYTVFGLTNLEVSYIYRKASYCYSVRGQTKSLQDAYCSAVQGHSRPHTGHSAATINRKSSCLPTCALCKYILTNLTGGGTQLLVRRLRSRPLQCSSGRRGRRSSSFLRTRTAALLGFYFYAVKY